ncbi:MAG: OmpH family outer membrane protein [Prevotellaceae bacterium]|jgi:outer membrane protein|nr:OmpH family outer membrane protein [Prevotellaceae bacterium]
MKNLSLIFNAILAIAVIVLFVLVLGGKSKETDNKTESGSTKNIESEKLPVAYINVDSLLINYQFAKDANEALIKKEEDARLKINTGARQLQDKMNEFQRKLENNAFLSRERSEQEQTKIMKEQQQLQELDAKLSQELIQEQQKMNMAIFDSINNFLAEYNKDKRFDLILGTTAGGTILQGDDRYNITLEVTNLLNQRMSKK